MASRFKVNYGDCLTPFELFFCEIGELSDENQKLGQVKTAMKKEAYSSFDNCDFWSELYNSRNFSIERFIQ